MPNYTSRLMLPPHLDRSQHRTWQPWNHFFYMALDGAIPPTPEPFTVVTLEKVGIDQFVQVGLGKVLVVGYHWLATTR